MRIFNTLGRKIEEFVPQNDTVRMYVCGITPYDTTHLGHARTYGFFDVVRRYFEFTGYKVSYVQNITDIDDPLFERARQLRVPFQDLIKQYVDIYFDDINTLNIRPADSYPRVSQEMENIVRVIGGLVSTGHGYAKKGKVYFRVSSFPDYGKLSRLDRSQMLTLEKETGEDIADPNKEDPLDFLLWKPSEPDEPSWSSPWGEGRPGWHIECSTMSLDRLGEVFDIHGGGQDLTFPHHENEIAQSESYTGKSPVVRYWLHVGMVLMGGTKMSKSLGNMVFVRDLSSQHSPNAIRLYLLGTHYRIPLDYKEREMEKAESLSDLFNQAVSLGSVEYNDDPTATAEILSHFKTEMEDDLNTPAAIEALQILASEILSTSSVEAAAKRAALWKATEVLGLRFS